MEHQEGLSRWNKMLPCTGQPTVAVVAEGWGGTPIGIQCPLLSQLRLEGDIP